MCARACVFARSCTIGHPLVTGLDDTPRNFPHRPRSHPSHPIHPRSPGRTGGLSPTVGTSRGACAAPPPSAPALRHLGLPPIRLSSSPSVSASPPPPGAAELASCPFRRSASAPQGSAGKVTVCTNRAFKFIKFIGFFTNE